MPSRIEPLPNLTVAPGLSTPIRATTTVTRGALFIPTRLALPTAGSRNLLVHLLNQIRRKGLIPVQPDDADAPSAEIDSTRWNDAPSTEIADGAQASNGAPEATAESTVESTVESATDPGLCDPDCPDCAEERAIEARAAAANPSGNGTSADLADAPGLNWLPSPAPPSA